MKMKMNKSLTAGSLLIGVGLSAAAVYAATPAIKNLASNISSKVMPNDINNNSTFNKNSMH